MPSVRVYTLHGMVFQFFPLPPHSFPSSTFTNYNFFFSMALETGIFASQAIWLWRVRHIRHEAKKAGKTYDEYVSENPAKKLPRSDSAETFVDTEAGYEKRSPSTCSEKTATSEQENTTVMAADATLKVAQPAAEALQAPPAAMLKPSGTGASRPSSPSPSA